MTDMITYDEAWADAELGKRKFLAENGMYSEDEEHSSCGVGLVVALNGKPSRSVVQAGIDALSAIWRTISSRSFRAGHRIVPRLTPCSECWCAPDAMRRWPRRCWPRKLVQTGDRPAAAVARHVFLLQFGDRAVGWPRRAGHD